MRTPSPTATPLHRRLDVIIDDYTGRRDRAAEIALEQLDDTLHADPFDTEAEARSIAFGSVLARLDALRDAALEGPELRREMISIGARMSDVDVRDINTAPVADVIQLTAATELFAAASHYPAR